MAGSVKLFETVRKCYDTMGIYSFKANQIESFNSKTFIFSLSNTLFFVSSLAYVLFRANTTQGLGISVFNATSIVAVSTATLIIIWRLPHILKLIGMCDSFIEKSKLPELNLICIKFYAFVYSSIRAGK